MQICEQIYSYNWFANRLSECWIDLKLLPVRSQGSVGVLPEFEYIPGAPQSIQEGIPRRLRGALGDLRGTPVATVGPQKAPGESLRGLGIQIQKKSVPESKILDFYKSASRLALSSARINVDLLNAPPIGFSMVETRFLGCLRAPLQ